MPVIKLNLIAAACENMGIGKNNNLPWRLKSEMGYFTRMTCKTESATRKNVAIMGRKTWDSIPPKFKPLQNRINFILSRSGVNLEDYADCYAFKSFQEVIDKLKDDSFQNEYENVWVVGGSYIYKEAMESEYFHRLYMTEIKKHYECDTFFPEFAHLGLREVTDPDVPTEEQEENGIKFIYKIYESCKNCKLYD